MFRLVALWAAFVGVLIFWIVVREEHLASRGKVPLGRLRRLWLWKDRRGAPRYRVDWPVRYQRLPPSGMNHAKSRDLSTTGVALIVSERLEAGTWIQVELTPPGQPVGSTLRGQVVWQREVPSADPRMFAVGVRFYGVDPHLQNQLALALKKPARGRGRAS